MKIPVKDDSDVIFNKSSLLKHFACINYIQISREFHFHRNYIYIYISSTLLNTKAVFELYTYLYLLDINANLYSFCIQIPVTL